MRFNGALQRRMWLGTVWLGHAAPQESDNADDELDLQQIFSILTEWRERTISHPCVKFCRSQIEVSDTGRYHLQVALATSDSKRWSWLAKHLPAHWEPAASWEAVANYCKKSDSRIKAFEDFGTMPKKAKRSGSSGSLKAAAIECLKAGLSPKEIALKHPEAYFSHHRAINELYKHVYMVWRGGLNEEE